MTQGGLEGKVLENFEGNLRDAYKEIEPGTMLHVDQLMNERRTNEELRNLSFYTADANIYFIMGKKKIPTLAITRGPNNLVLSHIDEACDQLLSEGNYRPNSTEAEGAIGSEGTELFDLTKLRLQGDGEEWLYLAVGTAPNKYKRLNREERRLAERVYGQGDDFAENMKMLADSGIKETRIYVLNPEYVLEHAKEEPIARASWLGRIGGDSGFVAGVRGVDDGGRVRGVPRARRAESAEGAGAQKTPSINEVLNYANHFVPDVAKEQFVEGLRKLYK